MEAPFSSAPAIFLPISDISSEPPVADRSARLAKIVENLSAQQDAIGTKMLFLIEKQSEKLKSDALEKLRHAQEVGYDRMDLANENEKGEVLGSGDFKFEDAKDKDELNVPWEAIDTRPYVIKDDSSDFILPGLGNREDNENNASDRAGNVVIKELVEDLVKLIDQGSGELRDYDWYAQSVRAHFEDHPGKPASVITNPIQTPYSHAAASPQLPQITGTNLVSSPINIHAQSRTASSTSPVRNLETIKDLVRRGNK